MPALDLRVLIAELQLHFYDTYTLLDGFSIISYRQRQQTQEFA